MYYFERTKKKFDTCLGKTKLSNTKTTAEEHGRRRGWRKDSYEEDTFYTMWTFASRWMNLVTSLCLTTYVAEELSIKKIVPGLWRVITATKSLNKFATSIAVYP